MHPDPENFESLRRVLSLKRHEQPPPGYFNGFSRDVMARIKAGETGGEVALDTPLLQRVLALFDMKPVFAGAFGMAVCALVISGVISSEGTSVAGSGRIPPGSDGNPLMAAVPATATGNSVGDSFMAPGTNSLVSLFDRVQLQPQQATYTIPIPSGN